jgi:predicted ABC-type transport system involved in lysophospholipase L1 biosynthesis ATPase subunit
MSGRPLLLLEDVHKSFPAPQGQAPIEVLRGVSLHLRAGESLAVVGPSGSGKSTLLSVMGALLEPTRGRVLLDGRDLASLSERERAAVRSRRVGFLFQLHHLLPQCSVWENVLVPVLGLPRSERVGGRDSAEDPERRARRLLERVGLAGRLAHRPAELSGGECLRAAVARSLINRPALLLADEPTGSLDAESAAGLAELLVELNREEGVALVVVTHSEKLAGRLQRRCRLARGVLEE